MINILSLNTSRLRSIGTPKTGAMSVPYYVRHVLDKTTVSNLPCANQSVHCGLHISTSNFREMITAPEMSTNVLTLPSSPIIFYRAEVNGLFDGLKMTIREMIISIATNILNE